MGIVHLPENALFICLQEPPLTKSIRKFMSKICSFSGPLLVRALNPMGTVIPTVQESKRSLRGELREKTFRMCGQAVQIS